MSKYDKKGEYQKLNEPLEHYAEPLNFEKVWLMFQETDKKFQETERLIKKQSKETDKQMKETDRRMKKLQGLFITQWGKLIESLVEGDLIKLLNEREIEVQRTFQNVNGRYGDINFEFDIIAINGNEIVIVEVKTTLRPDDVADFLLKLDNAKEWMPEYKDKKIIGAIACLVEQSGSLKVAIKKGLFAIKTIGGSASIINKQGFEPKKW